jgi:hypothetical protein
MIQMKTTDQLVQIARNKGSIVVDGSKYTSDQLVHIARNLSEGAFLHVENSDAHITDSLVHIARNGRVIFS